MNETAKRFEFGANWDRFRVLIDEHRIKLSEEALCEMLGVEQLDGMEFVDVGCGSGLSSLAARRRGARVVSFDYDPVAVRCTQRLRDHFRPGDADWEVRHGSVLDPDFLAGLGRFDVVYSWGVLHHTGNMWRALEEVVRLVRPGGLLFIAIYNDQRWKSRVWACVKRAYVSSPRVFRPFYEVPAFAVLWAGNIVKNTLRGDPLADLRAGVRERGMSAWHDLRDWIGGYPFEVARPEEIFEFYKRRGFTLEKLRTAGGGLGCNQFVFRREALPA